MKNKINKISERSFNDRKMLDDLGEDMEEEMSMYGEFVSSYFAWTGLSRSKTRANELNEITKIQIKQEIAN